RTFFLLAVADAVVAWIAVTAAKPLFRFSSSLFHVAAPFPWERTVIEHNDLNPHRFRLGGGGWGRHQMPPACTPTLRGSSRICSSGSSRSRASCALARSDGGGKATIPVRLIIDLDGYATWPAPHDRSIFQSRRLIFNACCSSTIHG